MHATPSLARLARVPDNSSGSPALSAGAAYGKEALLIAYLSRAMTAAASDRTLTSRSPLSFTAATGLVSGDLDFRFESEGAFPECDL